MSVKGGDIVYGMFGDKDGLIKDLGAADKAGASWAQSFARHSVAVGAAMTAAGATIVGSMTAALFKTAEYGEAILGASQRTGETVEEMQKLKHAAEQTGVGLGDVETAMAKLNKNFVDAAQGNKDMAASFEALGFSYEQLLAMSPAERFEAVGLAIASIEDDAYRTEAALTLMGRSSMSLFPLFAEGADGIARLKQEAVDLGLVLTQEQIENAEAFGDAWDKIGKSVSGLAFLIGSELGPKATELAEWVSGMVSQVNQWAQANQPLVETIVMVAAGVGAALSVLGPLLILLPGIGVAFTALGAIFSPVGIAVAAVIAGIVAGAYLIYENWDGFAGWFQGMWQAVLEFFAPLTGWFGEHWAQITRIFDNAVAIVGAVLETLGSIAYEAMHFIVTILGEAGGQMGEHWGDITSITDDSASTFLDILEMASDTTRVVWETIADVFGAVSGWLEAHWGTIATITDLGVTLFLKPMFFMLETIAWIWDQVSWLFGQIQGAWNWITGSGAANAGAYPVQGGYGGDAGYGGGYGRGMARSAARGATEALGGASGGSASRGGGASAGSAGITINLNFGRDSVRSEEDIARIEQALATSLQTQLRAVGAYGL